MPYGPDHALRDRGGVVHTFYFCVSRTEALLMASNTSYHERLYGLHRFSNRILALFVACERSAVLAHGSGREGSALLCFRVADPICYGESLVCQGLVRYPYG